MENNIVAEYMHGNTKVTIKNDYYIGKSKDETENVIAEIIQLYVSCLGNEVKG